MNKVVLITLLAVILAGCAIDIKPGSWPNPVNVKSKGVLPVAMLGSSDPDSNVYDIDPASVVLTDDSYNPLATAIPDKFIYEDVNGDSYMDLVVYFNTQDFVPGLSSDEDGAELNLCVTADYWYDGSWYIDEQSGCDTIVIRNKGKD